MRFSVLALLVAGVATSDVSVVDPKPPWECAGVAGLKRLPRIKAPREKQWPEEGDEDLGPDILKLDVENQLSRQDIIGGMRQLDSRIACCHAAYRVDGVLGVQVEIGTDGKVKKAKVMGPLANTPSGRCVEGAVKSALFPKFPGPPVKLAYPFRLGPRAH